MSPSRVNGLSKPYAALQIATWVCFPVLILQFLFFVSPLLPLAASIPCTLLFFACTLATAYYGYKACIVDPIDRHLAKHLQETGEAMPSSQDAKPKGLLKLFYTTTSQIALPQEEEPMKYCWVCEISVAEHSMHCKYCNKCVSHFDHHCLWLNTCVGDTNYMYFYRILWSISAMLVVHIGIMLGLVIDIFTHGATEERADAWFNSDLSGVVLGVLIFFLVFDTICLSAAAQLLFFHVGLRRKNLTTYQFIVTDNARKRQERQTKKERQSKRVVAVAKASLEGETFLALRLKMGQHCCAPCDPLPDEEVLADVNGAIQDKSSAYVELHYDDDGNGGYSNTSSTSVTDLARSKAASLEEPSFSHNVDGAEAKLQDGKADKPPDDSNAQDEATDDPKKDVVDTQQAEPNNAGNERIQDSEV
jgi:DHHC palmitoyltransferase